MIDLPLFSYGMIMADPPWCFDTWSAAGKKQKSPEGHYSTMSTDEIAALPVGHLAGRDCVLWLWATHPMLDQQLGVMRAWGFRFVTSGVWVKRTRNGKLAFGTGYRLRCASEPFLLGVNGDPETCRSVRTVIDGPVREHSRKPDEAYSAAETLVPNVRRADLFARQRRLGWDGWGNELDKFGEVA